MKIQLKNIFALTVAISCFLLPGIGSADQFPVYDGVIEPYMQIDVGSSVEGVVGQLKTERSQIVTKGAPLVILESSVEEATVKRAVVQMEVMGEVLLEQEKLAYAQRSHNRVEGLAKSNAVSTQKQDEAATEVKFASYRLQKVRDNKHLAEMDLKRAQALLDLRTIRSPISGVIVERFVSPGEFVDNQPLLKIAQMDPLRVEVIIPSSMFGKITKGMKAQIKPELDINGGGYTATVSIVDKVIDAASNTFGVSLELPNPDYKLPGGLRCAVQFLVNAEADAGEKVSQDTVLGGNVIEEKIDNTISQNLIEETKKKFHKDQLDSEMRSNVSIQKLQEDVQDTLQVRIVSPDPYIAMRN